jgi:hypothetical protein
MSVVIILMNVLIRRIMMLRIICELYWSCESLNVSKHVEPCKSCISNKLDKDCSSFDQIPLLELSNEECSSGVNADYDICDIFVRDQGRGLVVDNNCDWIEAFEFNTDDVFDL